MYSDDLTGNRKVEVKIDRLPQFYLVNPPIKVTLDNEEAKDLVKNGSITFMVTPGVHVFRFKLSFRETAVQVDIDEDATYCSMEVSCNRMTGQLDVIDRGGMNFGTVSKK